jgi:hypothetical protein
MCTLRSLKNLASALKRLTRRFRQTDKYYTCRLERLEARVRSSLSVARALFRRVIVLVVLQPNFPVGNLDITLSGQMDYFTCAQRT